MLVSTLSTSFVRPLLLLAVALSASATCAQQSSAESPGYEELIKQGSQLMGEAGDLLAKANDDRDEVALATRRQEALTLFDNALDKFALALEDVEPAVQDDDQKAKIGYLRILLLQPATLERKAAAYADDDPARAKTLRQAIASYDRVSREFRTRVAGMYARLYAGDCHRQLDEYSDALDRYESILDLPAEPSAFAELHKRTVWRAMHCMLELESPDMERAISIGSDWLRQTEPAAGNTSERLAAHFYLARAYSMRAAASPAEERKQDQQFAASNAQRVAQQSKERAEQAKELLQQLPGEIVAAAAKAEGPFWEEPVEEATIGVKPPSDDEGVIILNGVKSIEVK